MNAPYGKMEAADVTEAAKALGENPSAFFGHSYTAMQSIPRDDLEPLQLAALRHRFETLRDRIPMLKKLADAQDITAIETLEDVVPLLFEHTMYKSYPPSLLENGRFGEINRFLTKLSTFDLTTIDVSSCETIDEWMEVMDRESPLFIMHSSGTSGTMSFLPMGKKEWDKHGETFRITAMQRFGEDPDAAYDDETYCIFPYFRRGGAGHVRMCDIYVKHICGSEERLLTAYPGRMSSDLLYLAAKMRAAAAKGELDRVKISPGMLARKAEYEALQATMAEHITQFFADIAEKLKGKRIFFWGAQNLLFNMAKLGREKGLKNVFAANSVVGTGGDAKDGIVMPDDWRDQVCEFMGIDGVKTAYGMTEVKGLHNKCAHGHYHLAPWVIPYVLDPDTSALLPRSGVTTGRAAFFDIGAETRWGGFITGDAITAHWDEACPCGQSTVWIEDGIYRYSAARGGDDKISCTATEGAHKDAMDFLTSF